MFGASALISDSELERILRCAPLPSIERLRSYLVKWPRVDTQLKSMWEALKAGGFTTPVESAEATIPGSTPTHRSEPAPGPSTIQWRQELSKPWYREGKAPETQPKYLKPYNSNQAPTLDMWWRGYSGEQNHEVSHTNTDEICRILAEKAEARARGESTQNTRPPTPSPAAKRPRLDRQDTSRQARCELPSAPSTSAAVLPTSHIAHSTFQAPARPIGRLIVPSQGPRPLPMQLIPTFTPDGVRRVHRAAAAAHLRHPSSIWVNDLTYFGVPRTWAFPSRTTSLHRPPNPQPPPWCQPLNHRQRIYELRNLLIPPPVTPRSLDRKSVV